MIMVIVIQTQRGHIKNILGKLVGYKLQESQLNWQLLIKLIISQGQRDDYDHDLGHDYGIDYDLDHMQDIDTGNGHDGYEC